MGPMGTGSNADIPWVFLSLLAVAILVGLIVLAVLAWRRRRDERQANKRLIERTRAAVRQQLDAVADDIINLEDPVRASGDGEALAHYRNATVTYAAVIGEYETGDTAQELTGLAAQLDTAIWQLDTAEAILDGEPLPPDPAADSAASRPQPTRPYPPRSDRRSAVGVIDLITAMLDTGPGSSGPSSERRRHQSRRRHC